MYAKYLLFVVLVVCVVAVSTSQLVVLDTIIAVSEYQKYQITAADLKLWEKSNGVLTNSSITVVKLVGNCRCRYTHVDSGVQQLSNDALMWLVRERNITLDVMRMY